MIFPLPNDVCKLQNILLHVYNSMCISGFPANQLCEEPVWWEKSDFTRDEAGHRIMLGAEIIMDSSNVWWALCSVIAGRGYIKGRVTY